MPNGAPFTETLITNWIDPENSTTMSDQKIKFVGTKGRYEADQKERGIRTNTDDLGVEHINPRLLCAIWLFRRNIQWRGYGIESIKTFLNDVISLNKGLKNLSDLQIERPSFFKNLLLVRWLLSCTPKP